MFFNKIFQFLKGYVILLLKGPSKEKFLSICARRGIKLWDVRALDDGRFEAKIFASDFKKLKKIRRKAPTKIRIKRKCGLKFTIGRNKKRKIFFIFFLVSMITVFTLSRFIWAIEVVGAEEEKKQEILASAGLAGLKVGVYKGSLPDQNEIKSVILTNTEGITWAWAYLEGTKAIIEVRQSIPKPKLIDKNTPCDIVSNRDAIIEKITVKKGIAFCAEKDVVLKGDLLIGGTVSGNEESGYLLEHSMGEVLAKTTHKRTSSIKTYRDVRKKTGKKKSYIDIIAFGKSYSLYNEVDIPFEEYSIEEKRRSLKWGKDLFLCIEIIKNVYNEERIERIPLKEDEAVLGAVYKMEEDIAKSLLPGSKLLDKNSEYEKIDEDTLKVTLIMDFIEKIGEEVKIEK